MTGFHEWTEPQTPPTQPLRKWGMRLREGHSEIILVTYAATDEEAKALLLREATGLKGVLGHWIARTQHPAFYQIPEASELPVIGEGEPFPSRRACR